MEFSNFKLKTPVTERFPASEFAPITDVAFTLSSLFSFTTHFENLRNKINV